MALFFCLAALNLLIIDVPMSAHASPSQPLRLYIGTYTGSQSQGIYVCEFDAATGKLSEPRLAVKTDSPSYLALHPNGRVLYAVGENSDVGSGKGAVRAFKIDAATGELSLLNEQPTGGIAPCHLSVDATGHCVLVANYGGGSVCCLPIDTEGKLQPAASLIEHKGSSVNRIRQRHPYAHSIVPDPGNRFALACDLGLDKVLVYRLEPATATLTTNEPPSASVKPGLGPRHLAFDSSGKFAYLISEMGSAITVFAYDAARGELRELQTVSALPPDFKGSSTCSEIALHPSGKFLYASNRGHDSLAIFNIDAQTGRLTAAGYEPTGGRTPRHFAIDPSGTWLLAENQDSNTVVVFHIDPATGKLAKTGTPISVGAPVCGVFWTAP
jgi:6-phosphogluconolactonase